MCFEDTSTWKEWSWIIFFKENEFFFLFFVHWSAMLKNDGISKGTQQSLCTFVGFVVTARVSAWTLGSSSIYKGIWGCPSHYTLHSLISTITSTKSHGESLCGAVVLIFWPASEPSRGLFREIAWSQSYSFWFCGQDSGKNFAFLPSSPMMLCPWSGFHILRTTDI